MNLLASEDVDCRFIITGFNCNNKISSNANGIRFNKCGFDEDFILPFSYQPNVISSIKRRLALRRDNDIESIAEISNLHFDRTGNGLTHSQMSLSSDSLDDA
jgi:hypothetical protein